MRKFLTTILLLAASQFAMANEGGPKLMNADVNLGDRASLQRAAPLGNLADVARRFDEEFSSDARVPNPNAGERSLSEILDEEDSDEQPTADVPALGRREIGRAHV